MEKGRVTMFYLVKVVCCLPLFCLAGSNPGLTAALKETVVSEIYT